MLRCAPGPTWGEGPPLRPQASHRRPGRAARCPVYVADLDDGSPARQLRLGFDSAGRLLEIVVLRFDSGDEMIIHAMKARPQYHTLLG